jgi:hypothetical protein
MRQRALLVGCVALLIGLAGAGVTAWALKDRTSLATTPPAKTRPSSFATCPKPSLSGLPGRLVLEDTILRNLGGNVLGHELSYRYRESPVTVYVGYEILELLEDLDFETHQTVVDGRDVTLHTPKALGSPDAMRVATWEDEREGLQDRCRELAVVTRRAPQAVLLEVVSAF